MDDEKGASRQELAEWTGGERVLARTRAGIEADDFTKAVLRYTATFITQDTCQPPARYAAIARESVPPMNRLLLVLPDPVTVEPPEGLRQILAEADAAAIGWAACDTMVQDAALLAPQQVLVHEPASIPGLAAGRRGQRAAAAEGA
jgi:hypothetical protein